MRFVPPDGASRLAEHASATSLVALGTLYGTDKVGAGFAAVYDRVLSPHKRLVRNVLEMGVSLGSSLRMWRDFFPNATVWGVDTFKRNQGSSQRSGKRTTLPGVEGWHHPFLVEWKAGKHDRIKLVVGNQSDETDMVRVVDELLPGVPFDIIVEDGSHFHHDQQRNLVQLFPLVAPGGVYIMEDLQSHPNAAGYQEPRGGANTSLSVLRRYEQSKNATSLQSRYLTAGDAAVLHNWIKSVETVCATPGYPASGCWHITGIIRKRTTPRELRARYRPSG